MGVEYGNVRSQWGKELRQALLTALVCLLLFALFWKKAGAPNAGLQWRSSQLQQLQEPPKVAAGCKPIGEVEQLRGRYLDAVRDSILGVHLATPERALIVHACMPLLALVVCGGLLFILLQLSCCSLLPLLPLRWRAGDSGRPPQGLQAGLYSASGPSGLYSASEQLSSRLAIQTPGGGPPSCGSRMGAYERSNSEAQWGKELRQALLTALVCVLLFALFSKAGAPSAGLQWTSSQMQQLQEPPKVAAGCKPTGEVEQLRGRYLDAVRDSILGVHLATPELLAGSVNTINEAQQLPFNASKRARGNDSPTYGLSMVGQLRMNNLRALLEDVLERDVPGSFVECGVWRGGASIFAKAVLTAYGSQRDVHLVDSFQGLPPPTTANDFDWWSKWDYMRVSQQEVHAAFERFGLLDERVHFHKGFFRYALPAWRSQDKSPIAVLRMDGDMYESTMDELYNLWDSISPGGYVIVDDWTLPECQKAMQEFFSRNKFALKVTQIDDYGAWFQKTGSASVDHEWYQQFNNSRTNDDLKKGQ